MDSSGSLGKEKYQIEKDFVKTIIESLRIAPDVVHAGVITYSDRAAIDIGLSQFNNSQALTDALYEIPYQGRNTRIDLALQLTSQSFFTANGGTRFGVTKVAILITDGFQTPTGYARSLKKAAKGLEDDGIKLLVVGIGDNIDENALRGIVKRNEEFFKAKHVSLEELIKIVKPLTSTLCVLTGNALGICSICLSLFKHCNTVCGSMLYISNNYLQLTNYKEEY